MLWLKLKTLPKAIFLWAIYRLARVIINFRNRVPKILIYPNPRLKRIAQPVDFNKISYKERVNMVRKMGSALSKMTYGAHLGLAAPQIGINKRIIIVRGNVMFNPEWRASKAPPDITTEGCYSVPKLLFKVSRAQYGWAKWIDIEGKPFEDKLSGLPAVVFQHEIDHLNGICCADIGEEIK